MDPLDFKACFETDVALAPHTGAVKGVFVLAK